MPSSQTIKAAINFTAALAAFAAAFLWWKASTVVVRPQPEKTDDGWESASVSVEHPDTGPMDPFATGIEQAKINKYAAAVAAIAALLQAVGLLIPE